MKVKALLCAAVLLMLSGTTVQAAEGEITQSTSSTMTQTINGEKTTSQDAYMPYGTYGELGLNTPQDLYVGNQKLYIADTGNSRGLVVDLETSEVMEIGVGIFSEPRGIAADADGKIYVADTANEKAYRFTPEGELEFTFEKPTEPAYGKNTSFKPIKVAPADEGGVYLVCDGAKVGVVQLSGYGNFLGYFASNEVRMSIWDKIVDNVLTEKQKSAFLKKAPPSFANIFRGSDKLIYTLNKGMSVKPKKHSINGLDMLAKNEHIPEIQNAVDIHVTNDGRIFVLNEQGMITEITSDGYFLCSFGAYSAGNSRMGLFNVPTGIGVDDNGMIYVLDKEDNNITVFDQTPVQSDIYEAIELYRQGLYDDSQAILDNVLKYNNASYLAHIYSAKNYMQKTDYENARRHYEIANEKSGYSEAYWEIRNVWPQSNLGYAIILCAVLFVLYEAVKLIDKKTKFLNPVRRAGKAIGDITIIKDLGKMKYVMFHPIDGAYYIKRKEMGSVSAATTIYGLLFIILVLYQTATGFIFAQSVEEYSIVNVFLAFTAFLVLFLVAHYLISSINDGLGTFRSIYVTLAYCFAPMVFFMPLLIVISNFATIDDKFFIDFAIMCLFAWSISNVLVGFIQMHDYKFKEMIKNFLVTFFTVGVAILAISVVYLMAKQIVSFVYDIIVEVSLRV